jgi:hypothetical protein
LSCHGPVMAHDDKGAAQTSAVILPLFRVASTTLTASLSLHSRLCAQKRNRVAPSRLHYGPKSGRINV